MQSPTKVLLRTPITQMYKEHDRNTDEDDDGDDNLSPVYTTTFLARYLFEFDPGA